MEGLEAILASIHSEMAAKMLDIVRNGKVVVDKETGEAKEVSMTAAEMNVIRQFLKDNGIDSVPRKDNPLGKLASELPDFEDMPHSATH